MVKAELLITASNFSLTAAALLRAVPLLLRMTPEEHGASSLSAIFVFTWRAAWKAVLNGHKLFNQLHKHAQFEVLNCWRQNRRESRRAAECLRLLKTRQVHEVEFRTLSGGERKWSPDTLHLFLCCGGLTVVSASSP